MRRNRHTGICRILETGIRNETDGRVESLCISETFHDHGDLLAAELCIDAFKSALHTEPKVDFLRSRARSDIASELGYRLNRLYPLVDVTLEGVEERAVIEKLRWDIGDVWSRPGGAGLFDDTLDDGVDDEMRLWNLDVLLQVQQRELKFCEFLLGDGNT